MTNDGNRLAIIGGGAAGLACAIAAGERAAEQGRRLEIRVYERDDRVGRSILATGNGRCNFSNEHIDVACYRNAEFVGRALDALAQNASAQAGGGEPVHAFFESLGLAWREEADGRQYPLANKASVVVDVLRAAARQVGARETCEARVKLVDPPRAAGKPFTLHMHDGLLERADAVVVACGGRALDALEVAGMQSTPLRPVLGPLKCAPETVALTRELDNIRVKCALTLARHTEGGREPLMTEAGELMFRKYGVSGICVFNLSRFAQRGDFLLVDFLQLAAPDDARSYLQERRRRLVPRFGDDLTYEDLLRGLVLPRVSEALLKSRGIDPARACTRRDIAGLAELLCAYPLEIEGIGDADTCQVRRGGFAVDGFDPATMQSHDFDGLYVVGEALDVDGPCGGYNLHWAWASGLLAGRSAAERLGWQ